MKKRKFKSWETKDLKKRIFQLKPLWRDNKLSNRDLDEFYGIFYELVLRRKTAKTRKHRERVQTTRI